MIVPLALALLLGAGLWLIYDSLTGGARRRAAATRAMRGRAAGRLARWMARAGIRGVKSRDFVLFSLASGLATAILTGLILGWIVVAVVAGGVGLLLPSIYYGRRSEARRAAIQTGLAEAIVQMRDAIRAGLSTQEAFDGLAKHGPEALRRDFARLVAEARLLGPIGALEAWQERLADPLADQVAQALILSELLGGTNLTPVLDGLAEKTRAELAVQNELRAYQSRTTAQARFLVLLPALILAGVRQVNPAYLDVFNGPGQFILAGCAVSMAFGYAAMKRITRIPGDERVLN